jgi:hypothetical protein
MLKLSEFWSARAHSEDFTLTRMGFMTVRLRLLTCLLMAGLPAWALVDWLTLPAIQFDELLQAGSSACSPSPRSSPSPISSTSDANA